MNAKSMPHALFNRHIYRHKRSVSAADFTQHDFLHVLAAERAMERLDSIKRSFDTALIIGAANNALSQHSKLGTCFYADITPSRLPKSALRCVMDEEMLPIQAASVDTIICILTLHTINDVVGALIQMRRALKPDGLFLAITAGATSLHELRDALAQADIVHRGGISPHIAPFMEVRDAGALLQRTGFALPVVDQERLTLSYATLPALMSELKGAGEAACLHDRAKGCTPKKFFDTANAHYQRHYSDHEGRLECSAELLTLSGWSPHESQQQPAKRGSGAVHLGDVFS